MGHLKMVAATQPFISGSISKTINLPELASVEDIEQAYIDGWKMGLKCISVYRDNCKRSQPLNTSMDKAQGATRRWPRAVTRGPAAPTRSGASCPTSARRSPTSSTSRATRATSPSACSRTASPGEIFVKMAKEGSTLSGMMDSFAIMVSLALQYGVPLEALVGKFSHVRFEPSGYTVEPGDPDRQVDRGLHLPLAGHQVLRRRDAGGHRHHPPRAQGRAVVEVAVAAPAKEAKAEKQPTAKPDQSSGSDGAPEELRVVAGVGGVQAKVTVNLTDSMTCSDCGAIMVRAGACYKCLNCGSTSGCG